METTDKLLFEEIVADELNGINMRDFKDGVTAGIAMASAGGVIVGAVVALT